MPPPESGELETLRQAGRALGLDPTPAQLSALLKFRALLLRWNATHNLTAIRDPAAFTVVHLVDCMAALPAVRRHLHGVPAPRVLDVGSGGGLPGVVWAILWPEAEITCVDAVAKKVAFIREAAGRLGLPRLHGLHGRAENLDEPPFDLVVARAFASLSELIRLTRHLLKPGASWLAMKGKPPASELRELPPESGVFHVEPLQVPGLDAERCLVWIRSPGSR